MNDQKAYDDEIDLREYLDVILKRWKIIILFTLEFQALMRTQEDQPLKHRYGKV